MERIIRALRVIGIPVPQHIGLTMRIALASILTLTGALLPWSTTTAAGLLTSASISLSNPRPNTEIAADSVTYTFTGSSVDGAATVRCVQAVWATSPTGTTAPTGFSGASGSVTAISSTLINSSATGWSLAKSDGSGSSGQNNIYQYTNATGVVPGTTTNATFVIASITNPTATGSYYFRLNTYSNTDCSTGAIDNATVGFLITNGSTVSLTVDPTLSFSINTIGSSQSCAGTTTTAASSSTTIPFGNVTPGGNAIVCQDLQAAANAGGGYTIYLRYTGQPTNGVQTIRDLNNGASTNNAPTTFTAAGTEGYGYNTDDSSLSGSAGTGAGQASRFYDGASTYHWASATTTNAEIGYEVGPVTNTHYTIAHQAGISTTTNPGTYTTTIIYTCTPVY